VPPLNPRLLSGISARPAALKQVPISMPCHPFHTGKMALEGLPRSLRFTVGIDLQHDPRDLSPLSTLRIRISRRM